MCTKTIVNKQRKYLQMIGKTASFIRGPSVGGTGKCVLAQKLLAGPIFTMAFLLAVLMPLLSSIPATAAQNQNNGRYHRTLDIIDAVYLPGPKKVLVVGHSGLIGMLNIEGDNAIVEPLRNIPKVDFESVAKVSDNMAIVGGSTGQVFLFNYQSGELTKVAETSEFNEPVLDISVQKNSFWAVGSRGLIAHSVNGKNWEKLEISSVIQSTMVLPSRKPGTYYLGVANINPENFKFNARINGKSPVPDVDYTLFPDDGTLRIDSILDANAPVDISFTFTPGPPFGGGDVSWNVVLQENGRITLAGEFGLVIQSDDGGQSWSRRNGMITTSEQLQAYWLAGGAKGKRVVLAGAAGAIMMSEDSGQTWNNLSKPNKEGIFSVSFTDDGTPMIAGAVGMLGTLVGNSWLLVDRTKLDLMSWLRAFVDMGDGTKLLLGGRSTSLLYKNKTWKRIKLMIKEKRL